MTVEQELFKGKTLQDVFKDVYANSDAKRDQINTFIKKLVQMITTPEDAAVIAPIVAAFFEVQVKSDEHLIKIAQIAQRIYAATTKSVNDSGILSEKEKEQLLAGINKDITTIKEAADKLETTKAEMQSKVEEIEDELSFMSG